VGVLEDETRKETLPCLVVQNFCECEIFCERIAKMRLLSPIKVMLFSWLVVTVLCPMGILDICASCKMFGNGLSILKTPSRNILFSQKDAPPPNENAETETETPDKDAIATDPVTTAAGHKVAHV
jgi:hypothetical protein